MTEQQTIRLAGAAVVAALVGFAIWSLTQPASHPGPKADRLPEGRFAATVFAEPVRQIPLTKQVKVEPIKMAGAEQPAIGPETTAGASKMPEALPPLADAESSPAASPAPRVPQPVLADICARSGGVKQFTSHGRHWHCVYSRR
jgi:hypothetical protein